ncbi:MAG: malto-oligosyltrehalose synthase [Actinomycetota bacterium]
MSEPGSTYRVQLNQGFTFDDVAAVADYLAALGITHVYCSPYLHSTRGSTHGYDVTDHSRIDEELGGSEGFDRMYQALSEQGLAHIVDIVPNHTAIDGRRSPRWWDVLKHGRDSKYAHYFDIDWERHDGKVLAAVLGDELDTVLERGEIEIVRGEGEDVLRYHEHHFPLAPGTHEEETPLAEVIERQNYLLAFWRRAARGLNYRRFFDIDTLAALQMDQPGVFEETHGLVLDLIRHGKLEGLRVDHIDGLKDPAGYLHRLQDESGGTYTVVEKILEPGERLPQEWPVAGTTGYDFLNVVNALFIDRSNEHAFSDIYERFTEERDDLATITRTKKMLVMRRVMISDINRLLNELATVFEDEGWDFDEDETRAALGETIAAFHVYRTYLSPAGEIRPEDRRVIESAIDDARSAAPHIPSETFDRLRSVLLLERDGSRALDLVLRFQQTTGPIMAKGVEDTVFYNYNRFVSLNEVGGSPGIFGISPEDFHTTAEGAQADRPRSMLALSTHDTKRSEDVRARLNVLSEDPASWSDAVDRWAKIGDRYRSSGWPDRNAEYLLYQVLVGAWPLTEERAVAYMQKASKEAKRHTSWIDPNPDYDRALERFVRGMLGDPEMTRDVAAFVEPLVVPGRINSLAQTLIKLTYPGVPDTYQGTESWDLSLVDPDNRRPVDYPARRATLARALSTPAVELWRGAGDGAPKLLVTMRALWLRNERPRAFGPEAGYEPLQTGGPASDHLVGYVRGREVAVVVPRLTVKTGPVPDASIDLPPGRWLDVLTGHDVAGGTKPATDLLDQFPVALLVRS